jgi:hypothetical protein
MISRIAGLVLVTQLTLPAITGVVVAGEYDSPGEAEMRREQQKERNRDEFDAAGDRSERAQEREERMEEKQERREEERENGGAGIERFFRGDD